ncbi:MAG TPA: ABC transporter ATP-binding protein [Bryobacteraceae bacterium]|nr:ABC transporter ATP-binding protein [Bryobacteraceae bacterium]
MPSPSTSSEITIDFRSVSKSYPVYSSPKDRLKELLTLNRARFHDDFWALRDVSFTVRRGETFCVVGENGSGKSTLLQIIAGILTPSSGEVQIRGRVAALLELGSGFNLEFTGKENVYLNASILGLTSREIDARYQSITDFAEIGDFIHQPVKTYSSGMVVRLAFAVAIHVDPEILLVDEALAVGDIYFRQRCMRKVHELRNRGVTIIFVSHALGDVKQIGDRCLWLDGGRTREMGTVDQVIGKYLAAMTAKDSAYLDEHTIAAPARVDGSAQAPPELAASIPNVDGRHGDGRAEVTGIAVYDEFGRELRLLLPASKIIVRISAAAHADVPLPNIGFMLRNHLGIDFAGTNTTREGQQLPAMRRGDRVTVDFHLELPELYPGDFSFSPAVANGTLDAYTMCDWIDNAITLQMSHADGPVYGYMHLPCRVDVNARLPQPELERKSA